MFNKHDEASTQTLSIKPRAQYHSAWRRHERLKERKWDGYEWGIYKGRLSELSENCWVMKDRSLEVTNSILQRILSTSMLQEDCSLLGAINIKTTHRGWRKGSVIKCLPCKQEDLGQTHRIHGNKYSWVCSLPVIPATEGKDRGPPPQHAV